MDNKHRHLKLIFMSSNHVFVLLKAMCTFICWINILTSMKFFFSHFIQSLPIFSFFVAHFSATIVIEHQTRSQGGFENFSIQKFENPSSKIFLGTPLWLNMWCGIDWEEDCKFVLENYSNIKQDVCVLNVYGHNFLFVLDVI